MANDSTCDSPELWGQMRIAKESLLSNGFTQKYGSPPTSPTETAGKSILENSAEPHETVPSQPPAALYCDNTRDKAKTASAKFILSPPEGLDAMAPCTPVQIPSSSSSSPLTDILQESRVRPQPCIPLSRTKTLVRTPKDTKPIVNNQSKPPAPCIPLKHAQRLQHTPPVPSPLTQTLHASPSAPSKSPKALQTAISTEKTQTTTVEMTESDDVDEVLPYKRRGNKSKPRDGHRLYKAPRRNQSPLGDLESTHKLGKQTALTNTDERRISQVSGFTEGLHKGVSLLSDHLPEGASSPSPGVLMKKDCNVQEEEPKNELVRLQKEVLLNAHRGAGGDATASPEMLARCRSGPGTDRCSKEYYKIEECRAVPQDSLPDPSYYLESAQIFSGKPREAAAPELLKKEMNDRLRLCRELYKKTPTAYPASRDEFEKIVFSPTPKSEHKRILDRIRQRQRELASMPIKRPKIAAQGGDKKVAGKKMVQVFDNSWTDEVIVDWEYCPRCISDEIPYRAWFQNWLERTIECECTVDIFHQAFFNGTAHADGETSMMFMLDMTNYETLLDLGDEATMLHAHETSAGYCYNVNMQNKIADEAEEHRKLMERETRLQARRQPLRSPTSPVANFYLRPGDTRDIRDLWEIYSWYARNSFGSPNTHDLSEDEIRERIEECDQTNLPFIVAIDRRSASSGSEKVLGYACAREFDKHEASRFTAELEVYVKNEHTSLGVGRCLLDKVIELCDPTYRPRSEFEFIPPPGDKSGYLPGGRRRLVRMVITLGYVDGRGITEHNRIKQWLRRCADFEEQGVLRGTREKGGDLINVAYLVRRAGHSLSNKLG